MEIQTHDYKMSIWCSIYALFYTFCLYKNYSGVTFPFFAAGTLYIFLYYMRRQGLTLKKFSYFLMTMIMALGINVCLTGSEVLIVFDKAFIFVLFFTLFLHNLYDDVTWDVSRYAAAILSTVCSAVKYLPAPVRDLAKYLKSRRESADPNSYTEKDTETYASVGRPANLAEDTISERQANVAPDTTTNTNTDRPARKGKSNIGYVFLGIVISLPILLVVLPLLASSDIVFMRMLEKVFSFDINEELLDDLFGISFMTIVAFFAVYALKERLDDRSGYLERPVPDRRTKNPVVAITISVVMLIVYGLYCAIQIVYLFMGYGSLPSGYTYAEYVHEGFYQLVFVCLINLVLVLMCRKYSKDNMILKIMLTLISACTFIMLFSSAYRMLLYIDAYGLTFLRLFVLWALTVIGFTMIGTCVYIYVSGFPFYKYSLAVLTVTFVIFAFIRPDYQIARYNLTHDPDYDRAYIVNHLSSDAAGDVDKYCDDAELKADYAGHVIRNYTNHDYRYYPDSSTDHLRPKLNFRTWNYSIYNLTLMANKWN